MKDKTLKGYIERLFNVFYEHGLQILCNGQTDESESFIVSVGCNFRNNREGVSNISPAEFIYSLDATKHKQFKDILIEEGFDEDIVVDIMQVFLLKRTTDLIYNTSLRGRNTPFSIDTEDTSLSDCINAFMDEWRRMMTQTDFGKKLHHAFTKFFHLEDRKINAVFSVTIGTQP